MAKFIFIVFTLFFTSCTKNIPAINQSSEDFSTIEEKEEFLAKYIQIADKSFEKLDFHVFYNDNSGGMVPGPSDMNVSFIAQVPQDEINIWIKDLKSLSNKPDFSCFSKVSTEIDYSGISEWYELKGNSFIGVDRKNSIIIYRFLTQ